MLLINDLQFSLRVIFLLIKISAIHWVNVRLSLDGVINPDELFNELIQYFLQPVNICIFGNDYAIFINQQVGRY